MAEYGNTGTETRTRPRRGRHRITGVLAGFVVTVAGAAACLAPPAGNLLEPAPEGGNGDGWWLASRLDTERRETGVAALPRHGVLEEEACAWAETMAGEGRLRHDPGLGAMGERLPGWRKIGENVGRGGSVQAVWEGFSGSPAHRANMLDPGFTHQGVCVVEAPGGVYVVQRFAAL